MSTLVSRLRGTFRGELQQDEPLAPRTSIRVGGAAELLARPTDGDDLRFLLATAADLAVPVTILGGGANTLVADAGVAGVTVKLPAAPEEVSLDATGGSFVLGCGAPIARLPQLMREHRLVGAEFLAGIPGTLGGAVAMNAGTKQGETARVVEAVELVDAAGRRWVSREDLVFAYRRCCLPGGAVALRVRVRLSSADEAGLAASAAAMADDLAYRRRTQPLQQPSSGSVFQNPPGDAAGRLIEACGLKGLRRGGAQVSEKHANWIVNLGGALAADVAFLLEHARAEVLARFGIELHPEVKRIGRWER